MASVSAFLVLGTLLYLSVPSSDGSPHAHHFGDEDPKEVYKDMEKYGALDTIKKCFTIMNQQFGKQDWIKEWKAAVKYNAKKIRTTMATSMAYFEHCEGLEDGMIDPATGITDLKMFDDFLKEETDKDMIKMFKEMQDFAKSCVDKQKKATNKLKITLVKELPKKVATAPKRKDYSKETIKAYAEIYLCEMHEDPEFQHHGADDKADDDLYFAVFDMVLKKL